MRIPQKASYAACLNEQKSSESMACANCGNPDTIKAHLIPRAFCVEVQEGKSHAAQLTESGDYRISQSGIWDPSILCAKCDGKLGKLEDYARQVFEAVRNHPIGSPLQAKETDDVDNERILRFCAGILYKYSLTEPSKGKISLGRYQEICRRIALDGDNIPASFDAFILRPIRFSNDTGLFAYRAPLPDRINGVNLFRLMVGGVLIFVKTDRRDVGDPELSRITLQNNESFVYLVVPAQGLEEYEIPRKMVKENSRLSGYLDGLVAPGK